MLKDSLFARGMWLLGFLGFVLTPHLVYSSESQRTPASDTANDLSLEEGGSSDAAVQGAAPVPSGVLTVQPKDRLLIHWAEGSFKKDKRSIELRLVASQATAGTAHTYKARVTRGKGQLMFHREGEVVRAELTGAVPAAGNSVLEVEFTDPGVPASIAIEDGDVEAKDYKSALTVLIGKGKFFGQGGSNEAKVFVRDGIIGFDGWKANIVADLFSGSLDLKETEGRAKLRNFLGKTSLAGFTGPLQFETFKGALVLATSKGSVDFKSQNGSVQILDYDGDVHGSTESGAVTLRLKGRVNSRVESAVGNLTVSVPSSAGARVYVASDEGRLTVPRTVGNLPSGAKSLNGRMGGDGAGFLSLRSKAGDIKLSVY